TLTAPMAIGRGDQMGVALADNTAQMAGGYSSAVGYLSSVEIFDPAAADGGGAWTTSPDPLFEARYGATSTLLPAGQWLITGGYNGSGYTSFAVDIYGVTTPLTIAPKNASVPPGGNRTSSANGRTGPSSVAPP